MSRPAKPELNVVAYQGPPALGEPVKPDSIAADPVASAEWDRVSAGVDARESAVLAAYCATFSRVEKYRAEHDKLTNLWVETQGGVIKAHPAVGVLNAAERLLAQHAARLGMTPVDRGKVKAKDKPAAGKKISKYLR